MLGLIKKDFLLIKSNLKSITLILILYIIMSIQGSLVLTYIIPFLGVMILTSTFSFKNVTKDIRETFSKTQDAFVDGLGDSGKEVDSFKSSLFENLDQIKKKASKL